MELATGELVEIYLEGGRTGGLVLCPPDLIPAAGRYLLAHDAASSDPLPVPVFSAGSAPGGFRMAPPLPRAWQPGVSLALRGPLGRGFSLPSTARRVALVALGETAARLKPLLELALAQSASVALVSDLALDGFPPEVEIRPVADMADVAHWADYMAFDLQRESLPEVREKLGFGEQAHVKGKAQVLVVTPMPCGGIAECGVCAVNLRRGWKLACKDGPVFDLGMLI